MNRDMTGKIHPPKTMIMRVAVGSAEGPGGITYEMSTSMTDSCPIVRSSKSGKYWSLPWAKILDLAISDGINKTEPKQEIEQ